MSAAATGFGTNSVGEETGNEIINDSVVSLARRIRSRELSSQQVVSAFLSRIEQVNPRLNAVVCLRAEEALRDAKECDAELTKGKSRGPLHGVPFTVKDSFDTAGLVSTAGTTGRASYVPKTDATVVKRLRDAGGILLGKTNTPELTLSYNTTNKVYGPTLNPYDLSRTPGGSSGGAAAILAASGSPLDIGSDSAGSSRIPAHFCGIASIKATGGRVPRTGHIIDYRGPIQALTHVSVLARYVQDLDFVLPLIAGYDGTDPHVVPVPLNHSNVDTTKLRIAYFPSNGTTAPTRETIAAVNDAVAAIKPRVASVKSAFPPLLLSASKLNGMLVSADGMEWAKKLLTQTGTKSSSLGFLQKQLPARSTPEFVQLINKWDEFRSRSMTLWNEFDAIICPVAAAPAHKAETSVTALGSYVAAINVIGCPVVVARAGTSPEGLPIGVQVIAPMWREDIALTIARVIESKLGGWQPIANLAT